MQALPSLWTSITRGRNDVMSVQGTEGHEIDNLMVNVL